ncbi:sulfocyanin-like copper-binding protein [Vibrio fluvialis]
MKNLLRMAAFATVVMAGQVPAASMSAQVVHADLWDQMGVMGIKLDVPSVVEGSVSFEVINSSKTMVHEMLVVKVNHFHESLPYQANEARVIEDKVQDFGEVSELEPGRSGSLTVNLKPGKYLLLCNIPGHYEMGMFTPFIVEPKMGK